MFKAAICLGLATLATAQWAFTAPDGDLGELAPGNNVRQGDVHNFKWRVGLGNQPVQVLDSDGHASLWITSGLDHSFYRLLAGDVDSSSGGSWAWDTGTLSDDDIDKCQGVFIYRIERPVGSDSASYDWDTDLSVSSVSFRILKRSETETTQPASTSTEVEGPVRQTTLITQTTVATSLAPGMTTDEDSSTPKSTTANTTTTSERTDSSDAASTNPTDASTSDTASTTGSGSSTTTSSSSSATATDTPHATDRGLSVGAKAGIGIGAVAAAALVAIAGLLLYRRRGTSTHTEGSRGLQPVTLIEKPRDPHTQQHEYNGGGWANYLEVPQQQYPTAFRAEMMDNGRHELPGPR